MKRVAAALFAAATLCPCEGFSWDVIPSNAFPGFLSRPFAANELAYYANFSSLDICAVNVTCADGAPAHCPLPNGYPCTCAASPSGGSAFAANMEVATLDFARSAVQLHPSQKIFPYVYFTASETWFEAGAAFNRPENAGLWMVDAAGAPVLTPVIQGSELHAYNFTNPATRDFFVSTVIAPFLASDSVAGLFFDMVDTFAWGGWARQFGVAPAEVARLQAGTLAAIEAVLVAMRAAGKLPVLSTHSSRSVFPDLNAAAGALLQRYGGYQFYEFFCDGGAGAACADQVATVAQESTAGVGVQAHAPVKVPPAGAPTASNTTPPFYLHDFDFLAGAFLLGAGENSYLQFGAASCWTTHGCWPLAPALQRPLGAPQGVAARVGGTAMALQPNVDAIDGLVPAPGANSSNGLIVYAGQAGGVEACAAACLAWPAAQALLECQAFTFTGSGGGVWAGSCYLRLGFGYLSTQVPAALTVTSGRRPSRFRRVFAHAAVEVDLITGEADISWGSETGIK